ncbi:MAG: type II CRISPR-associated endonuclease Cas1 [Candidatus Krumholzibacteriia bacterium]
MKRTIEVSTRGTQLLVEQSRIQVRRDGEILASIPAAELSMVILGSTGVTVSSGVLQALGSTGGALLACDEALLPCGLFLPMDANTLHSERARLQAGVSAPMRKNLWGRLVRAKILGQAAMLDGGPAKTRLLALADRVRSGDEGNAEGEAARIYWPLVFAAHADMVSQPFRRNREGLPPNNLLNYGYTILRAATARALCAAGLHPAVGLHHRNRYSGFCLADDLMEPFRPTLDQVVLGLVGTGCQAIDKDAKQALIGVLTRPVLLKGECCALGDALERTASSLAIAIERQVKGKESAPQAAEALLVPELARS